MNKIDRDGMVKKLLVGIAIALSLLIGYYFIGANSQPIPPALLKEPLKTHYLIDQEYLVDKQNLFATMGHLLVFNPGDRDAQLKVTLYFENDEPQTFSLKARAKTSSESNYATWPVKPKPNSIFALKVESSEPVICQATTGWTNTDNVYAPDATTKSPKGIRETAQSYMAINQLGQEWYIADGIIINLPDKLWIKESEWAILLNPGSQNAQITLLMYHGKKTVRKTMTIPPNRVKRVLMDDLVEANQRYGARIQSDYPIAVQWLRRVYWYNSSELMTNWSIPAVLNR